MTNIIPNTDFQEMRQIFRQKSAKIIENWRKSAKIIENRRKTGKKW
jgi:hypothetical protein